MGALRFTVNVQITRTVSENKQTKQKKYTERKIYENLLTRGKIIYSRKPTSKT